MVDYVFFFTKNCKELFYEAVMPKSGNLCMNILANFPGNFQKNSHIIFSLDSSSGFYYIGLKLGFSGKSLKESLLYLNHLPGNGGRGIPLELPWKSTTVFRLFLWYCCIPRSTAFL